MTLKYKKIFTGSSVDVIPIKETLNRVGIIPIVKDDSESGRLAGFAATPGMQEVFVHLDEYEKATEILKEIL